MNHEEELFQKRILELANKADARNIATFTDFLNLNELNIFYQTARELSFLTCRPSGGYENAERQIIAFIPDALSYLDETSIPYPIACIRIRPLNEKYAEQLTHRDYLGAVLNLGLDRSTTGDILTERTTAWLFCLKKVAEFICGELTRVRHTQVQCELIAHEDFDYTPKYEILQGSLASVRLDSLLSLAFGSSRNKLVGLIEGGKVFVNARLVTSNAHRLQENDVVSVRGLGRFRYLGVTASSRKGRLIARVQKYI